MAPKSYFVFCLLALSAVQGTSGLSFNVSFKEVLKYETHLVGLLKNASSVLSGATNAVNTLVNLNKTIANIQNSTLNSSLTMVTKQFAQLMNISNSLNCSNGPLNFSKCNRTANMTQMRNVLMKNVTSCIGKVGNLTSKLLHSHVNILKNLTSSIKSIGVSQCRNASNNLSQRLTCLRNLNKTIRAQVSNMTTMVYNFTTGDAKALYMMPLVMTQCGTQMSLQAAKDVATLGMKQANCMAKMINSMFNSSTSSNSTSSSGSSSSSGSTNSTISSNSSSSAVSSNTTAGSSNPTASSNSTLSAGTTNSTTSSTTQATTTTSSTTQPTTTSSSTQTNTGGGLVTVG